MSNQNNEFLFYIDRVIATRDSVDSILSHYEDFTKDMSPEMKAEVDTHIERTRKMLNDHASEINNQILSTEIPW